MTDRNALMARIRSLNELVCDLPGILESEEADTALAFLEACQEVQSQAGELLRVALTPIIKPMDQK